MITVSTPILTSGAVFCLNSLFGIASISGFFSSVVCVYSTQSLLVVLCLHPRCPGVLLLEHRFEITFHIRFQVNNVIITIILHLHGSFKHSSPCFDLQPLLEFEASLVGIQPFAFPRNIAFMLLTHRFLLSLPKFSV